MAQKKRRLKIGFGVTNPSWRFEVDEDVWNEMFKLLCLHDYTPETNKAGLTRYHHLKWRHHILTGSDLNYLFKFDGYGNKLFTMAEFWETYEFPCHLEPEDIMRGMFKLLNHSKSEVLAQLVTQEKS